MNGYRHAQGSMKYQPPAGLFRLFRFSLDTFLQKGLLSSSLHLLCYLEERLLLLIMFFQNNKMMHTTPNQYLCSIFCYCIFDDQIFFSFKKDYFDVWQKSLLLNSEPEWLSTWTVPIIQLLISST